MIEKEGTDGAEEARNAFYHSSREAVKEHEEQLPADRISSALIERVCTCWMPHIIVSFEFFYSSVKC